MRTPGFVGSLAVLVTGLTALGQYDIDWYTVDGGGGASTGGRFAVSGTVGQPDTEAMSGGRFALTGGFWSVLAVVQSSVAPFLAVALTEPPGVIVSWPAEETGWRLQYTADLAAEPVVWTDLPPPYSTAADRTQVVEPAALGARFYRLIR